MRSSLWLLLMGSAGAAWAVTWLAPQAPTDAVQPRDRQTAAVQPVDRQTAAVQPVDRVARAALATPEIPDRSTAGTVASLSPGLASAQADAAMFAARTAWPALSPAARQAWTPPPPPSRAASTLPPQAAPPPLPPPAFPYQWLGQIEQEGELRFFLAGPQHILAVRAGEVLDQRWRINGSDAGRLQLTWLPTDTAVSVAAR